MRFQRLSDEGGTGRSSYGEANHATDSTDDERTLYGEPCHEVGSQRDEQRLYGDPQHEVRENPELPDMDLLLARMRAVSVTGPTVTATGEDSSTTRATER